MTAPGVEAKKILVTGSRGKSSIVRLLHAAFAAAGNETWARITGVVPRELGPDGERTLERAAGGHVDECPCHHRVGPVMGLAPNIGEESVG